jgi:hypothetical protein
MIIRVIAGIIAMQFLLLIIFILCNEIAGPKNATLWFAFISLTLGALFIAGKLAERKRQ